jgi:hypothetical protein
MEFLLHIHDTPERTAAAFGLGAFVGFSPFVGLHSLIALTLAFVFNLNRVAVFAGCWLNLPWFLAPYYAATTALGAWLTGTKMPPQFLARLDTIWNTPSWSERLVELGHLLRPLLLPFTLGSTLAAIPIGIVMYRASLAFLLARKRHHSHVKPGAGATP